MGLRLISVPVTTGQKLEPGNPQPLFEGAYLQDSDDGHAYAIAPDGSRFLMVRYNHDEDNAQELAVVLNWFEEVKQLAPVAR